MMNKDIEILENEIANLQDKVKDLKAEAHTKQKVKDIEAGQNAIGRYYRWIEKGYTTGYYVYIKNVGHDGSLIVYDDPMNCDVRCSPWEPEWDGSRITCGELKEVSEEEFIGVLKIGLKSMIGEKFWQILSTSLTQ